MDSIRRAAVAGSWYPGRAEELARAVDTHLAQVDPETASGLDAPRALIAPHAGLVYSGPVAAYAYAVASRRAYTSIVLVGPSHFVGFDGVAIWPRGAWDTPFGPIAID